MMLNIKQLLLYIGLLLCVVLQVCRSKAQRHCPTFCDCDLFEERNRAVCSAKRLINANIEIPQGVEILDFSYNDITTIDSGCLQNLVHLINLTLAHNAIHTIHIDAFSTLSHLQTLDLSYNRLEYVDEHLIEANPQLAYLNLEGNKLMSLGRQPLLRSTTLRTLNLRNSQIHRLSVELLSGLPQLQQIDLSQNLLITLSSAAFNAPRQLRGLELNENPLNCDSWLAHEIGVLRKRGIVVGISDCNMASTEDANDAKEEPMFERMELFNSEAKPAAVLDAAQIQNTTVENTASVANLLQVWRSLPDDSVEVETAERSRLLDNSVCNGERDKLCQRYRSCLERITHMLLTQEEDAQQPIEKRHIYTDDDVKLAFVVGTATGICMAVFIITCALCLKGVFELRNKRIAAEQAEASSNDNNNNNTTGPPTLVQVVTETPLAAPPTRTRQPRRSNPQRHSSTAHTRALVRQPYGPQDSFLSRLFGRPARHQYYRTLNQNTATLIRRLSRSNLFSNRLSQNYAAERAQLQPQEAVPSTARFYDNEQDCEPLTMANTQPRRPETPPPNYVDIVNNGNCDRK